MNRYLIIVLTLLAGVVPAHADVTQQTATGFAVTQRRTTQATASDLVGALGNIAAWWRDGHTYSQHASNLQLDLQAGGCFCERWPGGSVQHAQVLYVDRDSGIVRVVGALGPLQSLAVSGVLTFALDHAEGKSRLIVTYRIGGSDAATVERWAGPVDRMIGETTDALAEYLATKR